MNKKKRYFASWRAAYRKNRSVFYTYLLLRLAVILFLIHSLILRNYENSFTCLLVLVLFMLPDFFTKRFNFELPSRLEIVILVFIFCAEILGELQCYFIRYPHWDTLLHTTTGFIAAAFGYSLFDMLNRSERFSIRVAPIYLSLVAFCFSMTAGVVWEFFEFSVDRLFHKDMQKDTVITEFYSVTLDETNSNVPVGVTGITEVTVNGEELGLGGYLDVGLYDTMEDMFVNFVGALVFSLWSYFAAMNRHKKSVINEFIPRVPENSDDEKKQYSS